MRFCALLLLLALPAAALDPRFDWQTLETPHFEIHYHQGLYGYAQKVARAAEIWPRRGERPRRNRATFPARAC